MSETKPGHAPEIKEKKETEPKITVDFFFAKHGTAEDASRFEEAIKNADVYIPEAVGWTKEEEDMINEISQGKTEPPEQIESAAEKKYNTLYNRKIPVVLVDVPEENPLVKKYENALEDTRNAYKYFLTGNLDEALKKYKESVTVQALNIKEREDFIVDQLKKELKTLTQKFPQLKDKKNINVLVALGTAHTAIHHRLKSEADSSKMILGRDILVFDTYTEIIKKLIRNPEEALDDNLYIRSMMEEYIAPIIRDITDDNNKSDWAARKLAAKLSADQIRSFSQASGELVAKKISKDARRAKLIPILAEMGVKLPTTEEEIDKLINVRKK